MSDHTPGPWKLSEKGAYSDFNGNSAVVHATDKFGNRAARIAAPEMLKELMRVRVLIRESQGIYGFHLNGNPSGWGEHMDLVNGIDAAISKATGEEGQS